jgi:ParB family chromosome partitioning protein
MEKRLGRGLEALISSGEESQTNLCMLHVSQIVPNPYQPRTDFDGFKLAELAHSIKQRGMIQPVVVRQKDDHYELVAGERRWRAAKLAGLEKIPALLAERLSKEALIEMSLIENVQREDLNPVDRATGIATLMEECNLTQDGVSDKLAMDRSVVANNLRLLNLPDKIKDWIKEGKLTESHARAILAAKVPRLQEEIASQIVNEDMTVRQAEEMIYGKQRRRLIIKSPQRPPTALSQVELKLKQFFGTQVRIKKGKRRGKIEIGFANDGELNRILDLLKVYV